MKVLKKKTVNIKFYIQHKWLSWRNINYFFRSTKLKGFTLWPILQEMLNEVLQIKGKWYQMEMWIYEKWNVPEMVSTWVNRKDLFYYLNLFKSYWLFEAKIIKWGYNIQRRKMYYKNSPKLGNGKMEVNIPVNYYIIIWW